MKRTIFTLLLLAAGWQFSQAQQIINTTTKSTCNYQASTSTLVGCADEAKAAVFTFNENQKTFVLSVDGVASNFAIENRTYQAPYWTYRINNGEGVMFDLKINQSTHEYYFYPLTLTESSVVEWYH